MDDASAFRDAPFQIGDVKADPGLLCLEGPRGQSALEPKVMALLQVLAAKAGQPVSRDTLINDVWGVAFGGDESLTRAIHLLRKAFQTPHGLDNVIRTIPRKGYILDADVSGAPKAPRGGQAAAEPLLAVLPFDNLSSDPETQFFSDGVTEDIIDRLIRGTDLKVIGRTSSFQFRGDRKFEAAGALGASHVVDGSVRRAGDRVRIVAHLENAKTRETLWSDRFDRQLEDIFDVQDEISDRIAHALNRKMEAQRQTVMRPDIYDLYLQGQTWTQTPEMLMDAVAALERVTQEAPDFAPAWGALARNRALMRMYSPTSLRKALDAGVVEAIEKALAIDPGNRDGLAARYQRMDHFGPMREHHERIATLRSATHNSASGLFLVAFHEQCIGRLGASLAVARETARLDPLNSLSAAQPGFVLNMMGHMEQARDELDRLLRLNPEEQAIRATLACILGVLGDGKRLAEIADPDVIRKYPAYEYSVFIRMAWLYLRNDPDESRAFAESIASDILKRGAADTNDLIRIGQFGGADMMFELADRIPLGPTGEPDNPIGPMAYRSYLFFHDRSRDIRNDPRFMKLCARVGLVDLWLSENIRPDFADEVDYDFDAECAKYKDTPADDYYAAMKA